MKEGTRFFAPGSPLHTKRVPRDWHRMDGPAQRRTLVCYGYADTFEKACRVMGQHAAAMMRLRRERKQYAASRRHPEGND
jgi:hypothetical protein